MLAWIDLTDLYQRFMATWGPNLQEFGTHLVRIGLILLVAWLCLRFINLFIQRVFFPEFVPEQLIVEEIPNPIKDARVQTLATLIRSLARYIIYFIAAMMILDNLGVKTTSLLAGVGIVGLAVGFGAQNLVRDVITGFFIMFEHQFVVGDYIDAAGLSGKVEELGLRTTKLRDWGGELHYIPNGEIGKVTNYARGSMQAKVEVCVAYEEDIERVFTVMQGVGQKMASETPSIVEAPYVMGIMKLEESGVLIRMVARTEPLEQWAVERELRKRLLQAFAEAEIVIPYPHRTLVFSEVEAERNREIHGKGEISRG